ncbi:hypothetical protein ACQ86B_19485 [Mycolicibacterium aichiense]|uniref:hypothetical protein n=1 Tax=Mycolicibacterium aichiense TaxID=1799 RepID=UPI003D66CF3B
MSPNLRAAAVPRQPAPGVGGCGLADATDELGSIGFDVCTVVGLGLVVVGSTVVPLS